MTTQNLWGELPDTQNIRTPVQILREQATLLREKTRGVLDARVDASSAGEVGTWWTLYIVAPALKNYRFGALTILQPMALYPVKLVKAPGGMDESVAATEEQFIEQVKAELTSERVRNAIQALLVQSRE